MKLAVLQGYGLIYSSVTNLTQTMADKILSAQFRVRQTWLLVRLFQEQWNKPNSLEMIKLGH